MSGFVCEIRYSSIGILSQLRRTKRSTVCPDFFNTADNEPIPKSALAELELSVDLIIKTCIFLLSLFI